MTETFLGGRITLHHGDSLDVLRTLPADSVDAVVCDPPYGLGTPPDPLEMLRAWLDTGHLDVTGRGFMGREWDAFVPQPALWREGFRAILVEREAEFCDDIRRRMRLADRPSQRLAVAKSKGKTEAVDALPLFGGLE